MYGLQNGIELYEKKYDDDDIQIIGHKMFSIDYLINSIDNWHRDLADIILFPNNLYYFATNNFDSDYYLEELSDENIEDIKTALQVIIKEPEKFYEEYTEKSEKYEIVNQIQTIDDLKTIIPSLGIKKIKIEGLDVEKAKLRVQQSLCTDFCFGIFGEMLFYTVAENILYNKLVVSKVDLVTAPNTNAHGSDGVFCNEKDSVLYFGEAKFTIDLEAGISQALNSMEECINRINLDKNFILVHKKNLKNGYGKMIDRSNIGTYECKILIFLLHGNECNQKVILDKIEKAKVKFGKKLKSIGFVIISFPIFDKEHLKCSIAEGVDNYGK